MQSKEEFESKLTEMVKSLPDYTEGQPCFISSKNPVCHALNYKIGMGLSGRSLLWLWDRMDPMKHMFSSFTRMHFDIERRVDSPYYAMPHLCFNHLHLKNDLNPHLQINIMPELSKVSGISLTVLGLLHEGENRAVIFKPHWDEDGAKGIRPFAMPLKTLHDILDKNQEIAINHHACTHEQIDQLRREDIVTLPHQMPK